jgi:hypothetical protein
MASGRGRDLLDAGDALLHRRSLLGRHLRHPHMVWRGADAELHAIQNAAHAEAVKPLAPGATIAGDDGFCDVAAVAEDQWVLSGEAVPRSLVADNDQWESRAALNAYLLGTDRAEFEKAARSDDEHWFWESPEREPQVLDAFMRKYDEVVQNPDRFIAEFGVRYVAVPADKAERGYLREGWTMLQQGPYWQIWAREKSRS